MKTFKEVPPEIIKKAIDDVPRRIDKIIHENSRVPVEHADNDMYSDLSFLLAVIAREMIKAHQSVKVEDWK